jgi:hypothetical protein
MNRQDQSRQRMQEGLHSRRTQLENTGVLPLFEDGFYKGVEWSTLDALIHHLTLAANPRVSAPEAITTMVAEIENIHLLAHEALGEGLSCEACATMNKMLSKMTEAMLKAAPSDKLKDILSRYGVSYIPEAPKESQN